MGPRFMQSVRLKRPTMNTAGDRVLPSGALVSGAIWHRRRKAVIGGIGEQIEVTAVGFLPKLTDVRVRDQLSIEDPLGGQTFEVITVISGYDDRSRHDHVGVELRDI